VAFILVTNYVSYVYINGYGYDIFSSLIGIV